MSEMTKEARAFLEAAEKIVGPDGVSSDLGRRRTAGRDRYELSPVLRESLPVTVPDLVVWPRTTPQVEALLDAAFDLRIPITPRGKGTGNYGQAVPLQGGVVLDTSRLGRIHDVGDGWIAADAGARIFALERRAQAAGQELALMPSTVGSTIGGFIAGGSGGAGSIAHGWIWDGFVRGLDVIGCPGSSSSRQVEGGAARPFAHSYGTTGVISRVVVRLVPAKDRVAVFASLPDMATAAGVGEEIMALDEPPRLLSVDDAAVSRIMARTQPVFDPDGVNLRALVALDQESQVALLVEQAGGRLLETRRNADGTVLALAFNHVTERVLDSVDGFCHLQGSGSGLTTLSGAAHQVPGLMMHLDGFRLEDRAQFVSILFHQYDGLASVDRAKAELANHGVRVNDPHVWRLQRDLPMYRDAAATMDPLGLINPGKLPAEPS